MLLLTLRIGWSKAIAPNRKNQISNDYFISVVVPIRNEEKNIGTLLESLANQEYSKSNFEVIVVDDHSTDHSVQKTKESKEFFSNVTLHSLDENESGKKAALTSGIGREYEKHYGVKPVIITNAPAYYDIQPKPTDPKKIRLVHQGIANPSRKLELMFSMMEHLDDRFTLDLMLMEPIHQSNIIYLKKLKELARKDPRIQFVPPVSTDKIIPTINQYDIGIVLIPPINFNYKNTLPNKFFECIQARVALAIGPIPEMKKITEQFKIGVVSQDFTAKSLAQKINSLSAENINHFKQNAAQAARELNAEKNEILFKGLVNGVLES